MSSPIVKLNYGQIIKNRMPFVIVVTLIFVLISLVVTFLQPFKYESQVKILVIQKSATNLDAYSASKSAERIGRNLSQIISSSNFFSKVLNSGFDIDQNYFLDEENKRREQWQDMVDSEVPAGTTILQVSVYHPVQRQATLLAQAISYVVIREVDEYVGVSDVELKVVDAPLTSKYPVRPNIVLNLIFGLVIGILVSIAYIIISYTEDDEVGDVFYGKEKKKQKELKKAKQQESKKVKRMQKILAKEQKRKIRLVEKRASTPRQSSGQVASKVEKEKSEPRVAVPEVSYEEQETVKEDKETTLPPANESRLPDVSVAFEEEARKEDEDHERIKEIVDEKKKERQVSGPNSLTKSDFGDLPEFSADDEVKTIYD